ncbi:MAG: rhodanese-like domain-containing protein [Actinomycetota bacterium]
MLGEIDRAGVQRLIEQGAQIVDVLPSEEYGLEHIPGAVNIPLPDIAERSGELDRARPVVVYCFDFA